jgi:CubicO group peptidase (beta-lactamase class C family)
VNSRHELHSVTKSFASTLIGIAIQQGLIGSVNEYLLDFFPAYVQANPDPRWDNVTIEHLLTMSAGFEWDESTLPYSDPDVNDLGGVFASSDGVQFVLDKEMLHNPGDHWLYSGGSSLLLGAIVQQVADGTTKNFADEFLFDPLGFDGVSWFRVPGNWYNTFGGQLRVRTRDLAKLGFLYLNNGTWNGTQILSKDYVLNATYPHYTDLPFPPDFTAYGWQWWILRDMETFAALGRGGQKIIVSREHDMVVVFTATIGDYDHDPEFDLFYDYIMESVEPTSEGVSPDIVVGIGAIIIVAVVVVVYYTKRTGIFN